MYSLYRAWFGDGGPGEGYPRLQEALSPPDTVVRVGNEGEHQFVAHKGVLAAHSGYLKALLASTGSTSTSGSVSGANDHGQASRQPVTSVSVSSVGGEAFAPLLNYMYTGRLDVTLDNVYSVLLATHLLHMPGALEQCRAALLRLRSPAHLGAHTLPGGPGHTPATTTTAGGPGGAASILRPIPSRLMVGPGVCWPPPGPLYTATSGTGLAHLPQLQSSILMQPTAVQQPVSVVTGPTTTVHEPPASAHYSTTDAPSPRSTPGPHQRTRLDQQQRPRSPETITPGHLPFVTAFTGSNATSSTTRASSPSQSASPAPSSASPSPTILHRHPKRPNEPQQPQHQHQHQKDDPEEVGADETGRKSPPIISIEESNDTDRPELTDRQTGNRGGARRRNRSSNSGTEGNVLSVVYDVACCDGPVRFHRVLNENYSSLSGTQQQQQQPQQQVQQQQQVQPRLRCQGQPEVEGTSSENDENGGPPGRPGQNSSETEQTVTGSYTCGYCRHTFKSQYCYRKHAKRHLLPTRTNQEAGTGGSGGGRRQDARGRREVRLLDLNVQYYPCKICGCKFPSYYFVHKHRKLCHAEERGRPEQPSAGVQDQESTSGRKSP